MVHEDGKSIQLLLVLLSTLGGWRSDAHRALCLVETAVAARGMSTSGSSKSILFQRHAAILVTNHAFASCQVYCLALEEVLTSRLKCLSFFITPLEKLFEEYSENGSLQKVLKHKLQTGEVNGSTNLLITLSYASVTIFSFVNGSNAS